MSLIMSEYIGSGKVFVLSDTNPSPALMLTKLYNTMYCLWITICQHILQNKNSCWTAIYQRRGILLLFSTFGNEATREWCPYLVYLIIMHDHWVTTAIISVSNDPKDNRRPPHNIHQICFCKWLSLAHAQFKTFHEWLSSLYYFSALKVVMNDKHKYIQHVM